MGGDKSVKARLKVIRGTGPLGVVAERVPLIARILHEGIAPQVSDPARLVYFDPLAPHAFC